MQPSTEEINASLRWFYDLKFDEQQKVYVTLLLMACESEFVGVWEDGTPYHAGSGENLA